MKLDTFTQKILSFLLPESGTIQDLRERILRVITITIVVVGIPMLLVNLPNFIRSENWLFLGFSFFSLVYLVTLSLSTDRVSYLIRAVSVLIIAYLLGPLSFDNYGLVGNGNLWLLFFNLLAIILFGLKIGLIANLISLGTFIGFGALIINGTLEVKTLLGNEFSLESTSWLTSGFTMAFISLTLSISTGLLIRNLKISRNNLEKTYEESKQLTQQLEAEHGQLETRSLVLERRLVQIRTAAEISRNLGTILDPQELLQQVVDLIQTRFDLYYVGVFLIDENQRYAVLSAGTGQAGEQMISENHQLSVGGSSMVGWTTSHGQPRISLDVGQEAIRFKNPHLPLTRSELALPLSIGNQIIGAVSIQSTEPDAFDNDDITILQNIADSLAIALENARLSQQFQVSLREIQQLNRQYMTDSWENIWAAKEEEEFAVEQGNLPENVDLNEFNVPLTLRGDQVIGKISLATELPDFTQDEKEFIDAISNQAALALESARLLDEANKRVEQERAIQNLTFELSRSLDFDSLLQTVVKELGQIPFVKETSIHVTPPDELGLDFEDESK